MKKNLAIDVPKEAETEVQRVRGLKKSVFMRTRIALLSLVLVVTFSVASTFAYLTWTSNQAPNRVSVGEFDFSIVETINGASTEYVNTGQNDVEYGVGNKKVKFKASENLGIAGQWIKVSFLPVKERTVTGDGGTVNAQAYAYINEEWTDPQVVGEGDEKKTYVQCGNMRLVIADDWSDYWNYSNGVFTLKKPLEQGKETPFLLLGMENSAKGTGDTERIHIVAEAMQKNTTGTWAPNTDDTVDEPTD